MEINDGLKPVAHENLVVLCSSFLDVNNILDNFHVLLSIQIQEFSQ